MRILIALFFSTCLGMQSQLASARTSFLDVFTDSNHLACVELNWDGVAVHVKLRFNGLTFYVSPVISHYNPDFLVTAYPRLGDSPLLESYAALGTAQNMVSQPVVEFLSGADAPQTYGVKSEWGSGKGSDPGGARNSHKKTLAYYEAEVFGHPGNIFTWASKASRGENPFSSAMASNLVSAVSTQSAAIPNRINGAVNEIASRQNTELGSGFSLDAIRRIDPVALATNAFIGELSDLYQGSGVGQAINAVSDAIPGSLEEDLIGTIIDYGGDSLRTLADEAAEENGGNGSGEPDDPGVGELPEFDLTGLGEDVRAEVTDILGELTPENIRARIDDQLASIQDQVAQVTSLFQTLKSFASAETLLDAYPGVSAVAMPFDGMCPSDSEPFTPYYLSGVNILQWRFNIPEIVYPRTYMPFSNETTVGTLFPASSDTNPFSNPLSAISEIQNYGSVYPRNGYLLQSHPVKAAAVAAFRATHVVTRPNQPHIYRHARPSEASDILKLDAGYESFSGGDDDRSYEATYLRPDIEETGRWQLVSNEGGENDSQACHRFGAPENNEEIDTNNPIKMIGGVANAFTEQWADDKASDDNSYMFSMWRRYRCAPRPTGSGGLFGSRVFHIVNIEWPEPLQILH